jgi:hypothetical protein
VDTFQGNLLFASPYQLQFHATSRRDDLYSLVYLLMYMLNGSNLPRFKEFFKDDGERSPNQAFLEMAKYKQ